MNLYLHEPLVNCPSLNNHNINNNDDDDDDGDYDDTDRFHTLIASLIEN